MDSGPYLRRRTSRQPLRYGQYERFLEEKNNDRRERIEQLFREELRYCGKDGARKVLDILLTTMTEVFGKHESQSTTPSVSRQNGASLPTASTSQAKE